MCGIVGIVDPKGRAQERELREMSRLIAYRGPDGDGVTLQGPVAFGHRRLTILDLTQRGHQPMTSANGRFLITYNGEIYNFAALRSDLIERGIPVGSTGDTEPLLEHIAAFGLDATLAKIEGMFAFAVWDRERESLALARDRHGIKPLYYKRGGDGALRFASEMKCLVDGGSQVDRSSLHSMILGLHFPPGHHTLFTDVRSVEPGTTVTFDRDLRETQRSFFRVRDFASPALYQELDACSATQVVDRLDTALQRSTDLHIISDVPVASLISGGIDSALVSALARQRIPDLQLFHADVLGASERHGAEEFARAIGCELHTVEVDDGDLLQYAPEVTYHFEHPFVQLTNAVPFYLVSRLVARQGYKVLLTGEGSDEYFLGYAKVAARQYLRGLERVKGGARRLFHRIPVVGRTVWPSPDETVPHQIARLLLRYELDERAERGASTFAHVANMRERDWMTLALHMATDTLPSLLARNDRLAMAWGLESRFPFLGHDVAALALNLPSRFKVRPSLRFHDRNHPFLVDKWAVRQVGLRHVPVAARRAKTVFGGDYDRVQVEPELFADGLLADLYGLPRERLHHLVESTPPALRGKLVLFELWGRLFAMGRSVAEAQTWLRKHVRMG